MSARQHYSKWSTTYDADHNLTRDLDASVTREVLSPLRCRSILEIGCGTGKNTALLASIGRRLVALDFTPEMLMRARARTIAGDVSFVLADLTRPWPFAAGSADLITCNLVLEHVADLVFVCAEAVCALSPGGRLFICELHPFRQYQGKKAVYEQDGAQVELPAFVHHVSAFLDAAAQARLSLISLREWWHEEDRGGPPRLISFMFEK